MKSLRPFVALLLLACSPVLARSQDAPAVEEREEAAEWAFESSDIPVDPEWRFGQLANGMRYIVRPNATPAGTALVRLHIGSGSLSEREDERGLAHFLEHMAFNGSARVPEGEMVKLLEREGLAFGADTNASTGFETTLYKLDLPRNDPALLDTALMLMRETASELTLDPEAVERERGVILAERRDRTTYAFREMVDRLEFLMPGSRLVDRFPIGDADVLETAGADALRQLYEREYTPRNAVLIVVGDFEPELVEDAIARHFADWTEAPDPAEPFPGPVDFERAGETDIFIDQALSERISLSRHKVWVKPDDTAASRRQALLEGVGYAIVNRRLQALARSEAPPFRSAGFGTGGIFDFGRTTNLIVDTTDGDWREGLQAAVAEWRRALAFGFTEAEVAEQVTQLRTAQENAAASAHTRSNGALVNQAIALIEDDRVPSTPQSSLARFEAAVPEITPAAVLAALVADAHPLDDPLIRFRGRIAPEGGEDALRTAWQAAVAQPVEPPPARTASAFAYDDFGPAGQVVADSVDERLGIRTLRFANNVRLNLKPTTLEDDRVRFELTLDGGELLNTREAPLTTAMVGYLPRGGLGKHSQDELQTILAGRSVSLPIRAGSDAFVMAGTTTPRDLELQLELLTAAITDPGYRPQGEIAQRRAISDFFKRVDATPVAALRHALGGILSDDDPRFTLQPLADYKALDFAQLAEDLGPMLENGAIELALVGDFDPQAAIDAVARTLGALPPRAAERADNPEARQRPFTADRSPRVLYHDGEAEQALLQMVWPTTDDSDHARKLGLKVLERVVRLMLQEELRERLGQAYSPSAASSPSATWTGYGTFALATSVDVAQVEATRAAILSALARLRSQPVDADLLERARQPLLEAYDNALKSNGGWMSLVDRAQSEPYRIDRFMAARERYEALGPGDIQSLANTWLDPEDAVEILVLPRVLAPAGDGEGE